MPDPIRTFRHFRDVPLHLWRWPNFSPAEIACRGTGQLKLHPAALDGQAADRPLGLSQPRAQSRCRRCATLQAHGRHGV